MKIRYIVSFMLLASLFVFSSCSNDDDYTVATGNVIGKVETGRATVTAISAVTTGHVSDLSRMNAAFYSVGTVYGMTPDPTTAGSKVAGSVDSLGVVTTNLQGLTKGKTYYYATYVTLAGKLTAYGDVKSFVATDAKMTTDKATDITPTQATLTAVMQGLDGILIEGQTEMHCGFKLSATQEGVQSGVDYPVLSARQSVSVHLSGLIPGKTYYYIPYFRLGDGLVYGETKSFTTAKQVMEYVDLGLSVLWAKCNIGAEKEQETGVLTAYGDLTGLMQSEYLLDYSVIKDISGMAEDIVMSADIDGNSPVASSMPTQEQVAELISKTTQKEETVGGVKGVRFQAANGNSIFLPYTGYRKGAVVNGASVEGLYWTGNNYSIVKDYSHTLKLSAGSSASGLSKRSLGLAIRSVRKSTSLTPLSDKLVVGDLEGNGRIRIEIYNEYGATKNAPAVNPNQIKFSKNMVMPLKLTGISGNLKPSAAASHIAGIEYADGSWSVDHWSSLSGDKYDAKVTGDGTYKVWMETATAAEGAKLFCVDIKDLGKDLIDVSKLKVNIISIEFDKN